MIVAGGLASTTHRNEAELTFSSSSWFTIPDNETSGASEIGVSPRNACHYLAVIRYQLGSNIAVLSLTMDVEGNG